MRDNDSRLIFENYKNSQINEAITPEIILNKLSSLAPEAGLQWLRSLKGDSVERTTHLIKTLADILSDASESPLISKFKDDIWPKIRSLIVTNIS